MSTTENSQFQPKQLKPQGIVKTHAYPALTRAELTDLMAANLGSLLHDIYAPKNIKERVFSAIHGALTWLASFFDYRAAREARRAAMAEKLSAALLSHQKDKLSDWLNSSRVNGLGVECQVLDGESQILAGKPVDQDARESYVRRFNYLLSKEDMTPAESEELKSYLTSGDDVIVVREPKP